MDPKPLFTRTALALVLMVGLLAAPAGAAGWTREGFVWSRIVEHKDGSRTFAKQDINTKTLTEWTKDQNDVLIKKRIFQLDKRGEPRLALLFDGRENLLARTRYVYDDFGELKEEQLFNTRGQLVRRLVYGMEGHGIQSRPVAFTYNPERPDASPTRSATPVDPIMPLNVKGGADHGIPGAAAAASAGRPVQEAAPKKEKKSFRKKIGSLFRRNR